MMSDNADTQDTQAKEVSGDEEREFEEDHEERLEGLKQEKASAKASFTRARRQLLELIDEEDLPSRRQVREACRKVDSAQERAHSVMKKLADEYSQRKDRIKRQRVGQEMEQLECEFSEAQNRAQEYLDARKDEASSVCTETSEVTSRRSQGEIKARQEAEQVREELRLKEEEIAHRQRQMKEEMVKVRQEWQDELEERRWRLREAERELERRHRELEEGINAELGETSPATSKSAAIGKDLWKQLKRVSIPVFSGDKKVYESWKAAFLACIDQAPATPEYKLLQLRQYLSGEALKAVESLGHSAAAYEAAKDRLDRKFGGQRRQISLYLEELENFRLIRAGNSKDIEKFADLLDVAVVNLREAGRNEELGNGSFYIKLQRKMTESMLARYHDGSLRRIKLNPWKRYENGSCKRRNSTRSPTKPSEV